ncbi:MAG: PhzF family phenazine biosynthesis isomerase, partial [Actinophytocola sp.]|uniref:PhzF family phenazine biosynthesis protein n=1 Tax=Actinophytocola sp. TaxID=1872138 RepID=UPI003C754CC4
MVLRYAAFTTDPATGNPAGVVLDAAGLSDSDMQRIAAEVDYSETAFVCGGSGPHYTVRYFSPLAEVPFCGHATIATAVALADRDGPGDLVPRPGGYGTILDGPAARWPRCRKAQVQPGTRTFRRLASEHRDPP